MDHKYVKVKQSGMLSICSCLTISVKSCFIVIQCMFIMYLFLIILIICLAFWKQKGKAMGKKLRTEGLYLKLDLRFQVILC